jgi:hypothetical protein
MVNLRLHPEPFSLRNDDRRSSVVPAQDSVQNRACSNMDNLRLKASVNNKDCRSFK